MTGLTTTRLLPNGTLEWPSTGPQKRLLQNNLLCKPILDGVNSVYTCVVPINTTAYYGALR